MNKRHELFRETVRFENKQMLTDFLIDREKFEELKKALCMDTEKEILDYLGVDFYYINARDLSQNEGYKLVYKPAQELYTDEKFRVCPLGIRYLRGAYNSKFSVDEAIDSPLQGAEDLQEILWYPLPKPQQFDFEPLLEESIENSDRIRVGGFWTGIMGDSYRLIGFQNFLLQSLLQPELVKTLIQRMTDMYLSLNDKYFSTLKDNLDVWFFGNDFGSQQSLMMSEETWCDLFYESIKSLCSLAHSYNKVVMMHSCGAIKPLIPYLIKAGVDILDPIQVTAKGMSPEDLVPDFGGKIVFHGGMDTQNILIKEKPDFIYHHAADLKNAFNLKGGYIYAPSQILGKDIPVENILAMYGKRI